VLKAKLQLSDDDYRALLKALTLKSSSSEMSEAERRQVREHMQRLAERAGLVKQAGRRGDGSFAARKAQASPRERKVWALWNQLGRDGVVHNTSAQALDAWVERTVHVSSLRFATSAQLDTLIEALKAWQTRGAAL
jgi:phage gp16-like protein